MIFIGVEALAITAIFFATKPESPFDFGSYITFITPFSPKANIFLSY